MKGKVRCNETVKGRIFIQNIDRNVIVCDTSSASSVDRKDMRVMYAILHFISLHKNPLNLHA